jgi:purine-binding chemotaxis protein CheW
MAGRRLICTFTVADLLLGLDIAWVQEVLRGQEVTRLPLAADAVRGIINLRGRIIPALDLRRCLGMTPAADGAGHATIVVRASDVPVSFLVDDVGDVIPVDDGSVERPPETMRPGARELMHGVVQLNDRLLLELDLGRVLRAAYA